MKWDDEESELAWKMPCAEWKRCTSDLPRIAGVCPTIFLMSHGPVSTPGINLTRPFLHASSVSGLRSFSSRVWAGPVAPSARIPK